MQSRLKQGKGHITDTISKKMDKKPVIVPMPSPSYSTSTTDCYINLKKMLGNYVNLYRLRKSAYPTYPTEVKVYVGHSRLTG